MNKFLSLLLCLMLGLPLPLISQNFPPLQLTGPEIPGNNYDDDNDGTTDEIPADSIVEDSAAAGNYHWHFKDCEKTVWANVADNTFPSDFRVEKPAGSLMAQGEMVCYIANLPAATYTTHILYSTPTGPRPLWMGVNKPMRYNMTPENAAFLQVTNTTQWQQLVYTGSADNYYKGTTGGDQVSFVHPGGPIALVFRADDVRIGCGYLSIGATPNRTCPGESGTTPVLADYDALELGKETVPTAWNSPAFTNANTMSFTGIETGTGTVCNGTFVVKALHTAATTDRQYWSISCNDTEAVTVTTTNDASPGLATSNEDRFDMRWCTDQSGAVDTDCYFNMGNLHPAYADGDWSGTANARNYTVSLNTTIVRNINSGVSWNIFIAADLGANITPDAITQFTMALVDQDTAGSATKYFKGSSVTDIAQWGTVKWSSVAVDPSGIPGDSVPPVVTSPSIPIGNVEQTSFIVKANTGEAGTCKARWGTSPGTYTAQSTGGASVNGVCTQSATGLESGVLYYADMQVCDVAGNCGDSTEVSQKTLLPAVSGCTHYAANNGSGDGTSEAKPYRISNFWAQASPGKVLCLVSGTYNGSTTNMLTPGLNAENLNGNALAPITIKALTDGGVLIDGENVRHAFYMRNNDFFIVEGINVTRSVEAVVQIATGADNNIIRRVCAWDARVESNNHVFSISNNTGNLLEDVCAFGKGRKMFETFQAQNNIVRRAWAQWNQSTVIGPKMTYSIGYSATGATCENCIGTWNTEMSGTIDQPYTILGTGSQSTPGCKNNAFYGSIGYVRASDTLASFQGMTREANANGECFIYDNVVTYVEPGSHTNLRQHQLYNGDGTQYAIRHTTEIGGGASDIRSKWVQTNRQDYATLTAMNTANANPFQSTTGNGARVCFRYGDPAQPHVARNLTTTKLWPWPMDARIRAALTAGGKNPDTVFGGTGKSVTDLMEDIFGTIPAACKA